MKKQPLTANGIPGIARDEVVDSPAMGYVSSLNGRDRVEVVGNLSLAIQCLEPKFIGQAVRAELAQIHIQHALDILLKMDT